MVVFLRAVLCDVVDIVGVRVVIVVGVSLRIIIIGVGLVVVVVDDEVGVVGVVLVVGCVLVARVCIFLFLFFV